jgi:hypothetical protein
MVNINVVPFVPLSGRFSRIADRGGSGADIITLGAGPKTLLEMYAFMGKFETTPLDLITKSTIFSGTNRWQRDGMADAEEFDTNILRMSFANTSAYHFSAKPIGPIEGINGPVWGYFLFLHENVKNTKATHDFSIGLFTEREVMRINGAFSAEALRCNADRFPVAQNGIVDFHCRQRFKDWSQLKPTGLVAKTYIL